MNKLQALTDFIQVNLPTQPDGSMTLTSDRGKLRFLPAQRDLGLDQYQLAIMQYDAVLSWGRFPHHQYDPRNLYALLWAWLIETTDQHNTQPALPSVEIKVIDATAAVVTIALVLSEALNIVKKSGGEIPFMGERWRLTDPEVWFADEGWLFAADSQGVPLGAM